MTPRQKISTLLEPGLVSILIPTFNNQALIASFLKSILEQTYKDIEIVISDNNSDDKTLKIVEKTDLGSVPVRIYRTELNVGALANFSSLLSLARGEFSCIFPVGDNFPDNFIAEMVANISQGGSHVMCIPKIEINLGQTRVYSVEYKAQTRNFLNLDNTLFRYKYALKNTAGLALYSLMRTESAQKCLPIPIIRGGDVSFLRLLSSIGTIACTRKTTFSYSARPNWNTREQDDKFFFGDDPRHKPKNGRWFEKSSVIMSRVESNRLFKLTQSNSIRLASLLLSFQHELRLVLKRLIAQACYALLPNKLREKLVTSIYLKVWAPNYYSEINQSVFFSREVKPVFRIKETNG